MNEIQQTIALYLIAFLTILGCREQVTKPLLHPTWEIR